MNKTIVLCPHCGGELGDYMALRNLPTKQFKDKIYEKIVEYPTTFNQLLKLKIVCGSVLSKYLKELLFDGKIKYCLVESNRKICLGYKAVG